MPERRLHVLFVARWYPSHDQPGRGTFVADLAAALLATGAVDLTVASFDPTHVRGVVETRPERGRRAEELLAGPLAMAAAANRPRSWGVVGIPVARLPAFLDGDRRRPGQIVEAHVAPLLAFSRAVAARRAIDIVHAHTGLPDGVAAARLADELDVPLLTTEHASTTADDLVEEEARQLYRRLLAPPRHLVAVSRALAHDVARALGVSDEAIDVLPNAVPVEGFPLGAAADRDPNELLYVGSRKASKGIEPLLRAFAQVRASRPALRLRLIGSPGQPADEARWEALVSELGIEAVVEFEVAMPREDVAAAMRHAAVFVHPSPRETFGMVAAEALASGLPVVATPSGGVDEIVGRDGRFGAIARSTAAPALADAIEQALAASGRMDRAAMRAHIESRYAAPSVTRRTLELYERLIGRQGRAGVARAGAAGTAVRPTSAFGPALVIALARGQAIERLGLLPPALRDGLAIVTSPRGRYADDRELPPWGKWSELDPEQFYREALQELERSARPASGLGRLRAALGGPNLERQKKELAARNDEIRREGTDRFLLAAVDRLRPSSVAAGGPAGAGRAGDPSVWLVALDADDVLLADRIAGASVAAARLAPGGLRWLADAWDEAGRPASPAPPASAGPPPTVM